MDLSEKHIRSLRVSQLNRIKNRRLLCLIDLERQRRSVLVVSHLAVQRCLYAYFTGVPMEQIPYIKLPQHVVVELEPGARCRKAKSCRSVRPARSRWMCG